MIQLSTYNHPKPNKNRSGDYCMAEWYKEEKLAIGLLADGVGGRPCDWRASKESCERVLAELKRNTNQPLIHRLRDAVLEASQQLQEVDGACSGLLSTLVAVVWDIENEQAFWCSIGDSRLYALCGEELLQCSTDQTKAVIRTHKDG